MMPFPDKSNNISLSCFRSSAESLRSISSEERGSDYYALQRILFFVRGIPST